MKKILPLIAMSFLLVGCDAIEGTLKVHEPIALKAKKSGLFSRGVVDMKVPATVYRAKLNPTSSTNINLEMEVSGKKQKFPFAIPKGTQIPEVEGRLSISSMESGQPYDLEAIVFTNSNSTFFSQNESCIITYRSEQRCNYRPVQRCRTIQPEREICEVRYEKNDQRHEPRRGGDRGDHGGREGTRVCTKIPAKEICETRQERHCWIEQVPVYGMQVVDYEKVVSIKNMDVDVTDKGNVVAEFNHRSSQTQNLRRGASYCR